MHSPQHDHLMNHELGEKQCAMAKPARDGKTVFGYDTISRTPPGKDEKDQSRFFPGSGLRNCKADLVIAQDLQSTEGDMRC